MFIYLHTLIACGPSNGKEVNDVFQRPGARVGLCWAKRPLKTPGCRWCGRQSAGLNLETVQLSHFYISEILLNVMFNNNKKKKTETKFNYFQSNIHVWIWSKFLHSVYIYHAIFHIVIKQKYILFQVSTAIDPCHRFPALQDITAPRDRPHPYPAPRAITAGNWTIVTWQKPVSEEILLPLGLGHTHTLPPGPLLQETERL